MVDKDQSPRSYIIDSGDRMLRGRNGTRELPQLQPGDWVRTKLDNEKQWTTEAKSLIKTKAQDRTLLTLVIECCEEIEGT